VISTGIQKTSNSKDFTHQRGFNWSCGFTAVTERNQFGFVVTIDSRQRTFRLAKLYRNVAKVAACTFIS